MTTDYGIRNALIERGSLQAGIASLPRKAPYVPTNDVTRAKAKRALAILSAAALRG